MKLEDSSYRKAVLSNGITLVCESYPYARSVALGCWVRVGSAYETPAINGISHFVEHMVFKGTQTRTPLEIATCLECVGGDLNAFTDREYTCYHATFLPEHLDRALDVISDLVIRPTFPKDQLERERKVLLQELAMSEDSPDDRIGDMFFTAAWKKSALGQPVIGTKQNIQSISRAQLMKFFKLHYRPENIVISVAGNVDFEELKEKCEAYFKFEPSKVAYLKRSVPVPEFKGGYRFAAMNTEQVHVLLGYEGVGFKDPYRFDGIVLSFFLGGGMSSRLFQEIRENAALAYSVDCDFVPFSETGAFTIYLATSSRSLKTCLEILGREIRALVDTPLSQTQLDLVKGQLRGTILLSSEQMEVRQESLGRNELVFGRHISVDEVIGEIDRVSPQRIHQLALRLFRSSQETLVVIGKNKPRAKRLTVLS